MSTAQPFGSFSVTGVLSKVADTEWPSVECGRDLATATTQAWIAPGSSISKAGKIPSAWKIPETVLKVSQPVKLKESPITERRSENFLLTQKAEETEEREGGEKKVGRMKNEFSHH